jgi:hypothetical protein
MLHHEQSKQKCDSDQRCWKIPAGGLRSRNPMLKNRTHPGHKCSAQQIKNRYILRQTPLTILLGFYGLGCQSPDKLLRYCKKLWKNQWALCRSMLHKIDREPEIENIDT